MPDREVEAPHGGGQQTRRKYVVQVEELCLPRQVEESGADGGHELDRSNPVLQGNRSGATPMSTQGGTRQQ